MRITYVLPYPELGGGVKVALQHAALLRRQGFEVNVLGEGPAPDWAGLEVPYHDYSGGLPSLPEQDLVIATFYTTIAVARDLRLGPIAHFCQGYEGGLVHLAPAVPEIEAAYALDLPTLVVTPALGELLRTRFGRESAVVPPPLDPLFRPLPVWSRSWRPRRAPQVAVPGIFEAEVKGVPTALAALASLKARGRGCRVLRFSLLALSAGERRLLEPDRYLRAAPPAEIAAALRECDLLLLPSRAEEGFGLPLLEAMASGVPAVASRIPSTEYIGGAAALVAPGDAEGFATAAAELLDDARAWRRARRRGLAAALRFRPEEIAPRLAEAVRWAAGRKAPALSS
ncbi:MAG TPA: glycosyltransferase [Thermoanaerobaculia bacterium]|nr:glycosyltransferase [Thermoanaerobaculia bacterium]